MTRLRVYCDTNALFPYYVSDLLGFLASAGVITLLWSDYLADEVTEVVARESAKRGHGRSEAAVRSQWNAIRAHLTEGAVAEAAWQAQMGDVRGPDPDDLPHMAAAIAGRADVLVTHDSKGFPLDLLERAGIRRMRTDAFLCELLDAAPDAVVAVVVRRASRFTSPPMSSVTYIETLGRTVPVFAARVLTALRTPVPWRLRVRTWLRVR